MAKTAGQFEREAADAIRPIFERAVKELRLDGAGAAVLVLRMADAYVRGRGDGFDVSALPANRALSAQGIAIALMLERNARLPDAGEA